MTRKKRNPYAKELWKDKRYMQKVCPSKRKRKLYEEQLKRMEKEANEVQAGYRSQFE